MGETEAIVFLEKTLNAKKIVNELTGDAQTDELHKLLSSAYDALDEILSPLCPTCGTRSKRFITSPAKLFDPDMANYPGGTRLSWTGDWFCPECRRTVAYGEKWWLPNSEGTSQ